MNIVLHTIGLFLQGSLPILIPTGILAWFLQSRFQKAKTFEKTREAKLRFIKAYIRFKKHQTQFETLDLHERGHDTFENHPKTGLLKRELDESFEALKEINP